MNTSEMLKVWEIPHLPFVYTNVKEFILLFGCICDKQRETNTDIPNSSSVVSNRSILGSILGVA